LRDPATYRSARRKQIISVIEDAAKHDISITHRQAWAHVKVVFGQKPVWKKAPQERA